jgi:hypothetical protein
MTCPECGGDGIIVIRCTCGAYAAEHGCGGIKSERTCEVCGGTGEIETEDAGEENVGGKE